MIKNLFIAALGLVSLAQADTTITGAGASFPAPVYQKWTYTYSQANSDVKVTYQSIGSGAGLNQIKAGTVDFAGTDNPLKADQQEELGLTQFPMLTGGVVVIVNIPGVKNNQLKLSRQVLADIFMGKITMWNDKAITALNSGVKLPKKNITVVHRSDSSGTSFVFTNYLSKVSPEWKEQVGQGSSVKWPVGIGGQKNPGVCNNVTKISGSIGYTEYTYAVETKLPCVQLENSEGKYVKPTPAAFSAAAASADWDNAPGFYMELTDKPGATSWPIAAVTYILIRNDADEAQREAMKKYFTWCFTTGADMASKLHYVPMPKNVVDMVTPKL